MKVMEKEARKRMYKVIVLKVEIVLAFKFIVAEQSVTVIENYCRRTPKGNQFSHGTFKQI